MERKFFEFKIKYRDIESVTYYIDSDNLIITKYFRDGKTKKTIHSVANLTLPEIYMWIMDYVSNLLEEKAIWEEIV